MEKIWSWRRWKIEVFNKNGEKIARKSALDESRVQSIQKEIKLLKKLNSYWIDFVPWIVNSGNDFFEYKYIPGTHFYETYKKSNPKEKNKLVKNLLEKVYKLDKAWVIHGELIRPFTNVLVKENGNIFILDFERGREKNYSTKNLRSFSQWLKNEGYLTIPDLIYLWKLETPEDVKKYILKKINKIRWHWILLRVFILVLIDLWTKYVFYDLEFLNNFFFITKAFNEGIAWGIEMNMIIIYLASLISFGVFLFVYYKNFISSTVFLLFLAWAIGNITDRIFLGGVRDFINIGDFPIFNMADVYLTLAVILLIREEFFSDFIKK